jgi:Zn-dependent protease with chaperone function
MPFSFSVKSLLDSSLGISKKIIFVSVIFFSIVASFFIPRVMAADCVLPSHDDIKTEVNSLIEQESKATVLQKVKKRILISNGYIEITPKNSPNIYSLIEIAAKIIGVNVPSKIYLNIGHSFNFNCCNAFVTKSCCGLGETYLAVGSTLLCELTPQEIKAVLEHEFMHVKDRLLEKLLPKINENNAILLSLTGAWFFLVGFSVWSMCTQDYLALAEEAGSAILLGFLSKQGWSRVINNSQDVFAVSNDLERNADLHVLDDDKKYLASALKKVMAMLGMEMLKYYPSYFDASIVSDEIKSALIKKFEDGSLDIGDPMYPSLQSRLAYLKEACDPAPTQSLQELIVCVKESCDPSMPAQIQDPENCGPSVAA